MDIQKIPAVQQKRIVTFVNHFIIDAVSLLNRLINSSEDTLWRLEKRMRKLEITLKLLESKLSFIPEVDEKNTPIADLQIKEVECSSRSSENISVEPTNVAEEGISPEIQKYHKMVQFGVPAEAVKLKMQREGFDPNLLP